MKFAKEFKATLEAVDVKLDEALALLPKFSAIEVDTSKMKLTGDEIIAISGQASRVRDILAALQDLSEQTKRFIAAVETDA